MHNEGCTGTSSHALPSGLKIYLMRIEVFLYLVKQYLNMTIALRATKCSSRELMPHKHMAGTD